MAYSPGSHLNEDEIAEQVERTITEHDVVLFMKGTDRSPECEYSRRALGLLAQYRDDMKTVDVLDAIEAYRTALKDHSGWETIPQAYVNGEFIGGSDVLDTLDERGELESKLER